MHKIILFLLLTVIVLNAKNVSLVLPWKHQFQFAGYYVAKEMGFYKDAKLNVTIKEYNLKRDNTKSVAFGKYDFGVGHSSLIIDKLNEYPNIVFLNVVHQSSPLILLSKKRDDLSSLKDITGKKVMMSRDQTYTASINAMLYSENLEINNYKIIDTSFDPIDLINGTADIMLSYSANEPFRLKEKGIEYTIFDPKDYGFDFYSDILFTSREMITNYPNEVKAFDLATRKGWRYAYEHIDETIDIILKHYNTQNRTKEALFFEATTLKQLAFKDGIEFGDIDLRRLRDIANTYRLLNLVHTTDNIDYNDFIYKELIQDIKVITQEKNKQIFLINLYTEYKQMIWSSIFLLLLILSIALYFRNKSKLLLKQKTKELDKTLDIFDKNISSSKTDIDGNIISVSKAFCEVSGYSKEELIGNSHKILRNKETPDEIYKDLWETITSGKSWSGELINIKKDGTEYWIKSIISPIFDSTNKTIIGYEAIRQDITLKKVLKEFNEKLKSEVELQTIKLRNNKNYLDTLFDINHSITYVLRDSKLERVNKAFLEFVRTKSLEEFLENHNCICDLFDKNIDEFDENYICHTTADSHSERVSITKEDKKYIFNSTAKKFMIDGITRWLINLEDITELEKLATTDKLTGLYNRIRLDEELTYNYAHFIRYKKAYSIILIDVDFFKNVNDTYGHLVGDKTLIEVSSIIKASVRMTDIVGRWGGEEFMIISPNTELDGAIKLAENIRHNIEITTFENIGNITISAGIAQVYSSEDTDFLINKADEALYRAKHNGRNRVEK